MPSSAIVRSWVKQLPVAMGKSREPQEVPSEATTSTFCVQRTLGAPYGRTAYALPPRAICSRVSGRAIIQVGGGCTVEAPLTTRASACACMPVA